MKLSVALTSLSSCGILLAAGLTAYLTLSLSEQIQNDLEDSRDKGVALCFERGNENGIKLGGELVSSSMELLKLDMESLFRKPAVMVETTMNLLLLGPISAQGFNDFRRLQWGLFAPQMKAGITEIALTMSLNNRTNYFLSYEFDQTRTNPRPYGAHAPFCAEVEELPFLELFTTPYGKNFKVYWGSCGQDGQIIRLDGNDTKCDYSRSPIGRCRVTGDIGFAAPQFLAATEKRNSATPVVMWAPLERAKGSIDSISAFVSYRADPSLPFAQNSAWFTTAAGIDLLALQTYLKITNFEGERRYIAYVNPWEGGWELLALSHGDAHQPTMTNITDPLIAEHINITHFSNGSDGFTTLFKEDRETITWIHNGEKYWAKTTNVPILGGLQVGLAVLVPHAEALATITNATDMVQSQIAQENKDVEDKQDFMRGTLIPAVMVPMVFVLISVFVFFAYKITRPLAVLAGNMSRVSSMDLNGIDKDIPISAIDEVGAMQRSFIHMYESIVEYRNYLPVSMLDQLAVSSDDEADKKSTDQRHKPSGGSSMTSSAYTTPDYGTVGGTSSGGGAAALHDQVLRKRRVTITVTNVCDWHNRFDTEAEMLDCFNNLLPHVLKVYTTHCGTPDTFCGDRMMCSFNAVRPMSTHCVAACKAIQGVQQLCQTVDGSPLRLTAGVATGQVLVGNVGCEGMKKFSIFGTRVTTVYALERYSRHVNATVACSTAAFKEAETSFYFRMLDNVLFRKANPLPTPVYELCHPRMSTAGDSEWMYQMQEGAFADPWHPWNKAFMFIISSPPDWAGAEALIDAISKIPHEETTYKKAQDIAKNRLVNCIRGREYQTVEILFH
eukprot:TRINITY_DN183_c2_g1_i3.p1 TRINITY_DN183_c2_g1~~TRINITY_DN183_c2_g1_i3.p1  ORF type:complete len:858 (+),score=227.96 TRINITY_DN183_c2_g1_i3:57-2576(+)